MPNDDHTTISASGASPLPALAIDDGVIRANSRDVAMTFGKEHRDVLRSIDNLIEQEASLASAQFCAVVLSRETGHGAVRDFRAFDMDRDGFTLLAMGFTGPKALKWKLAYIAAFNKMEEALRHPAQPLIPQTLPEALRLAADLADDLSRERGKVALMQPKAAAFDRIADTDGSLCITDAAKTLQVQPKALFGFLRAHGWIYSPPGGRGDVAYSSKLQQGLLEHKTTTVHRSDGSEKTVTQARITAKGLTRLASEFPPPAKAA